VRGPAGVDVLPAPRGVERFAALDGASRDDVLRGIRETASSRDVAILDLPAGIHPDGLTFSRAADLALVVTTPDPAALADAYAVVKLVSGRSPGSRLACVVNQVSGPAEARQVSERLRAVAARFLGVEPAPVGWIPRDAAVARATAARKPVVLAEPGSPAAAAFRLLAGRVAQALDTLPAASSGFPA
jgi:flagellar biosynthesis protein FlhG